MNSKIMCALALAATCVSASEVSAKSPPVITPMAEPADVPAPALDAEAAPAPPPCCSVPALTAVELEFANDASSRTSKAGEMVALRLAEPLVIGDQVVAPAGSKAVAEIIQASKAGLMGKAGELTFAARTSKSGGRASR